MLAGHVLQGEVQYVWDTLLLISCLLLPLDGLVIRDDSRDVTSLFIFVYLRSFQFNFVWLVFETSRTDLLSFDCHPNKLALKPLDLQGRRC